MSAPSRRDGSQAKTNNMKIFGLRGNDPEVCISLLAGVVSALKAKGVAVAVLVEAPDGFDIDRPGKDSYEHRRAGAHEVVIASAKRWALLHEDQPKQSHGVQDFAATIETADLLLLRGFEAEDHPRMAILDNDPGGASAAAGDPRIVAQLRPRPDAVRLDGLPVYGLEDYDEIADFLLEYHGLGRRAVRDKKP